MRFSSTVWAVLCFSLILFQLSPKLATAQRVVQGDTLYGNEWIDFDAAHVKLTFSQPGLYRIDYADLVANGLTGITGADLRVQLIGEDRPAWVSNEGAWSTSDYMLVHLDKVDAAAFDASFYVGNPDELLSPSRTTITDSIACFISLQQGAWPRVVDVPVDTVGLVNVASTAMATYSPTPLYIFTKAVTDQFNGVYSSFRAREGWTRGLRRSTRVAINPPRAVSDSPAELSLRVMSSIVSDHEQEITFGDSVLRSQAVGAVQFDALSYPVTLSGRGVILAVTGLVGGADRHAVGDIDVRYQRLLNLGDASKQTSILGTLTSVDGMQLSGLNPSDLVRVWNSATGQTQLISASSGFLSSLAVSPDQQVHFVENEDYLTGHYAAADFGDAIAPDVDYLIVTSKRMDDFSPGAADWSAFRASTVGGSYRTQVVYVEDLYNRYGYGATNHAGALRNAISAWADGGTERFVLLFGKGREFNDYFTPAQQANPINDSYYVPTFGTPGSDNLIAFNPITSIMTAAIGRLPVTSGDDVRILLDKYQQMAQPISAAQTIEDQLWRKRFLHLGGGGNAGEQRSIRSQLEVAERIIEDSELAGFVEGFYKNSDEPVQLAENEELFRIINDGTSFITFFGHSSQGTFDFNIDNPDSYDNRGKYPVMLSLGCYAGSMHAPGRSIGERFMLYEDKAAIGFGATVGLGYIPILSSFIHSTYRSIGNDALGLPIGRTLQLNLGPLLSGSGIQNIQQGEQFSYNGDPGYQVYVAPAPDIVVDAESVVVGPQPLLSTADSLTLTFDVVNLGVTVTDSFAVSIAYGPAGRNISGSDTLYFTQLGTRLSASTRIATGGPDAAGLNQVRFTILPLDVEQGPQPAALQNDQTVIGSYFIAGSATKLLSPLPNSVVRDSSVSIYIQNGGPWDSPKVFEFELFEGVIASGIPLGSGTSTARSVAQWNPTAQLMSGKQYAVRARVRGDSVWSETNFWYSPASEGWSKQLSSPGQFAQGRYDKIRTWADGSWQFDTIGVFKTIINKEFLSTEPPQFITNFETSAFTIRPWNFTRSGVAFLIGDSITSTERFNAPPGEHGSINGGGSNRAFSYPMDTKANRDLAVRLLDSIAQDGHFIYVITCFWPGEELDASEWLGDSVNVGDRTLFGILREHGAQKLDEWASGGTKPYTAVYKKGTYGMLAEEVGADRNATTYTEAFIPTRSRFGIYEGPDLGPAVALESAEWDFGTLPADTARVFELSVVRNSDTASDTLFRSSDLVGQVDLSMHSVQSTDDVHFVLRQENQVSRNAFTPEQMKLNMKAAPNLTLREGASGGTPKDTLSPGELFDFDLTIFNASPTPSGPAFTASVSNLEASTIGLDTTSFTRLDRFAGTAWTKSVDLSSVTGTEALLLFEVNKDNQTDEADRSGNVTFQRTQLSYDETNPILKILHDGELLMNRALLPSSPVFELQFQDDESFIADDSLATIEVSLVLPDGTRLSGVELPGEVSRLNAAVAGDKFSWSYVPGELATGIYVLEVLAKDGSGNASSTAPLRRSFEIDTRVAISSIVPYPNPMVDRVRFQYEITGSLPEKYQIDIYTSSGRLVTSLDEQTLGELKVGRHLTDGFWDATDAYGQRLARGVYLYRFAVTTSEAGEAFETRETDMDQYTKAGFGKLVILQ